MIKKTKLSPSKKLSKIRKNIDKIDIKILHLLKQRRKQVIQIVKVKPKRKRKSYNDVKQRENNQISKKHPTRR